MPKSNADWWRLKFRSIARRHRDTNEQVAAAGWVVVRIWEHEHPTEAAHAIEVFVRDRTACLQRHASNKTVAVLNTHASDQTFRRGE
jgi:DNA mismatch endonuclease (patch repair protein)